MIDESGNVIAQFRSYSKADTVAHRECVKRNTTIMIEDAKGTIVGIYKPKQGNQHVITHYNNQRR